MTGSDFCFKKATLASVLKITWRRARIRKTGEEKTVAIIKGELMVLGTIMGSSRGDEIQSDSGYIPEEILAEIAGRLEVECERRDKMVPGI